MDRYAECPFTTNPLCAEEGSCVVKKEETWEEI
jgi:hypothetical protein